MMNKWLLLCSMALPVSVSAEISRNNYVDWIVASSAASSNSHFIQWKNLLQNPGDCILSGYSEPRTRISTADKELFSLLLTARAANKKVGFYYVTTPTTGAVPGHGSTCQITNAWLESE